MNLKQCEQIIGYTFKNKALLKTAFTHSTYTNENGGLNNERLEFLGDSVLGLIVSEMLYEKFKDVDEGFLTIKKQALVSKSPLSEAIIKHNLDKFILLGQGGERQFKTNRTNLAENLFEAITAAIYLDGDFECAKRFVFKMLDVKKLILSDGEGAGAIANDYKTKLQHFVQSKHLGDIKYEEVSSEGPPHDRIFTMAVIIDKTVYGVGKGKSHKLAGHEAAKNALKILQGEDNKS